MRLYAKTLPVIPTDQDWRSLAIGCVTLAVFDYKRAIEAGYILNGRINRKAVLPDGQLVDPLGEGFETKEDLDALVKFFKRGGRFDELVKALADDGVVLNASMVRKAARGR